jgi:HEAT repeat protein
VKDAANSAPEHPTQASLHEVEALVASGEAAAGQLVRWLDHPSWSVRRAIVLGLAGLGDAAVRLLCESLGSERSDETRIAATVDALVSSRSEVEPALLPLAQAADEHVVCDVAQILGRRRSLRGVDTLIALTAHADDNVAAAAMEALGRIGSRRAVDALLTCLESQQFFRTFPAIDVLSRTGDPRVVAPLAKLLRDPRYAFEAARALGRTGDRMAVRPLADLLTSPQDGTVRVACLALLDLRVRHLELYGVSAIFEQGLREAGSDAAVRRLDQCTSRASHGENIAICTVLGALRNPAGVPILQRLLLDRPEVAEAAALALRKLGSATDGPEFLNALRRADSAGRRVLLPLVSSLGASEALVDCLADPDANVRALACDAIARVGNARVAPALFDLLADPNARVVHAASAAIQSLGSEDTERLALAAARSSSPSARRAAMRILAYFAHPGAFEALRDGLSDADARVREAAIHGLAYVEDAGARDCLLAAAEAPVPATRAAAMRALGDSPQRDARSVQALSFGLRDTDPWVRYYAAQSLGKQRHQASAPELVALLGDPAGQVRVAAIEALSHVQGEVAIGALTEAARSSDLDMQRAALLGLSISRHEPSLPLLREACSSADSATRLVALSALATFTSPDVLDVLAAAARDPEEGVRTAALGFLGRHADPRATDLLIELLAQSEQQSPVLAALASPSEARVAGVARALCRAGDELAPLLTSCLARLHSDEATIALIHLLDYDNAAARKAAVATLLAIGNRDAMAQVSRLSSQDPDPDVRRVSAVYLAQ